MRDAFVFIASMITELLDLLNSVTFSIYAGQSVSLLSLYGGFILIAFVISIFWKGARA